MTPAATPSHSKNPVEPDIYPGLKIGDWVIAARTTLRPAHTRKNGELIPSKVETKLITGEVFDIKISRLGVTVSVFCVKMYRREVREFALHEVTRSGTNPLFVSDK